MLLGEEGRLRLRAELEPSFVGRLGLARWAVGIWASER